MIIVSQDKDLIINFENVTVIGIATGNSKEIDSITTDKKEQYLGIYETEERAKEVLQEILKQKAMFELYRLAPTGGRGQTEMLENFAQKRIILDTYEMPKE